MLECDPFFCALPSLIFHSCYTLWPDCSVLFCILSYIYIFINNLYKYNFSFDY